ncbi:MAG: sugar phosphate isomerase/epimerase family protein [Bacteroidota bacterium]|nr:sugar phosphate isomerase/epimerase family protein [Bacteroidota bacterium]
MLEFGFVTDEIDPHLGNAVRTGLSWGVRLFEIRCTGGRRVPDLLPGEIDLLRSAARNDGLRVTALSPGVFKTPATHGADIERELSEILPRTLDLASALDVPLVIVFGFRREENEESEIDRACAALWEAGESAAEAGITLAVENEPGFLCDSGSATAHIIGRTAHHAVRANWDPANAVGSGEQPYPEGYASLKPFIANVHAKDTLESSLLRCVPIGEGVVDWDGQLRALASDGVVGHVTIETHCEPLAEMSRRNLETLTRLCRAL